MIKGADLRLPFTFLMSALSKTINEYNMKNPKRLVHVGIEGCGKSSEVFKQLNEKATPFSPVLFACKNYVLMTEQIKNWSKRFEVPLSDFAIASSSFNNARYCSNPQEPSSVPSTARFIFTSQACLQRNKHLDFTKDGRKIEYHAIVVDEFDLSVGLIPSLDYLCNHAHVDKRSADSQQLQFLAKNYTRQDVKNAMGDEIFISAAWMTEAECDVHYLTSELLAGMLLNKLGFTYVYHSKFDFRNKCTVNVFSSDLVGNEFIAAMNSLAYWHTLSDYYDYIITDKAKYDGNDIVLVNHTTARGSNNFLGKNILTILTHVPKHVISLYRDVFCAYGLELSFDQAFAYYYRDRLCQAVGRVLNFRGSSETDVISNSKIINCIMRELGKEFPYNIEFRLGIDVNDVLSFVQHRRKSYEQHKKEKLEKIIDQRPKLDSLFSLVPDSFITLKDVKTILKAANVTSDSGRGIMKPTQVAEYFGLNISNKSVSGKRIRAINGLTQK